MENLLVPVIILLVAAVISVIVLMVSGKNKKSTNTYVQSKPIDLMESNVLPDLSINDNILPDIPIEEKKEDTILPNIEINKEESILPKVNIVQEDPVLPQVNVIKEEPELPKTVQVQPQVVKKVVVVKKEAFTGPPPTIDIPVPKVDDTEVTVEEVKSLVGENASEAIQVEEVKPLNESVNQDEIISVEMPKQIVGENTSEAIQVEEAKPIQNEVGEGVTVEEAKPLSNDLGETAFKSIPNGDTNINSNIQFETPTYNSNKTEIFNLEEIQEALKQREENKREQL